MSIPPASPSPKPTETVSKKTMGLVSLAVMSSRLLGLVREMVLNGLFGGTKRALGDALTTAFALPNMLRDLFAEGALSTAFITVFAQTMKTEGDQAAWKLARKVMTLALVFMSILSVLGVLLAPWIVPAISPGWVAKNPDKVKLAVQLAQIMYPFILLVSIAALVMGILNARKVFGIPAMASTFFNIFSILSGALLGWWFDPHFGRASLFGFAIGVLVGGLAQLVIQIPSLVRTGYKFGLDFQWRDAGVRKVLQLMGPAVISGSVIQVNVLLNVFYASYITAPDGTPDGPRIWLNAAFRLIQLPLGIFGVVIGTVMLPAMARLATDGVSGEFKNTLAKGLKLVFLMTVPSAVGMALLAEPIIALIYQHNNWTGTDTAQAALALRTYAFGLVFFSGIRIVQPAFYALNRRFVPLIVSVVAVLVSAACNYFTVYRWHLGIDYLALGTSLSALVNFSLLTFAMRQVAHGINGRELAINFIKLLVSAAAMALVCIAAKATVLAGFEAQTLVVKILSLGSTIGVAALVYFAANALLKNEELAEFTAIVQRKLGRSRKTS
ncbi:MAG: virulence factor MviN [Verrucomicrobiaceae bacterium]|nr:virulence factor MviN [Verrucomicrobiaceae bacterium]